jgi:ABC-type enterobactin transport system permease subunit
MNRTWKQLTFISIIVAALLSSSLAFAGAGTGTQGDSPIAPGTTNPFIKVQTATCTVATWLQGPIGIAVGFLVLVAGLIAMQVANRDAIPMITRAVIGTALLIGAGATFAAIITTNGCANAGTA